MRYSVYVTAQSAFLDGYCSTVQGLLDWFEVDLGFTKLLFIQTGLYVRVFLFSTPSRSPLVLFWTSCTASPARWDVVPRVCDM